MMARTQITLDPEMQRKARKRASDMGISLAEYIRRLVAKDIGESRVRVDVSAIFDLFDSGGSDIARNKDAMIAEAFAAEHRKQRRRSA